MDLRLKKTFAIAKGSADIKANVLAILGGRFCGEAAGSVAYGPTVEQMENGIRHGISALQSFALNSIDEVKQIDSLNIVPTAKAALMGMAVNALSSKLHKPPWELLGLVKPEGVRTTVTFALDNPAATAKQIAESPYPIVKIKMGSAQDAELIELLATIRGKELRVDANGGWRPEQAEEMITRLARLGVRVIEQPTSREFVSHWPMLKGRNKQVELVMDEGMGVLDDFNKFGQYCDGINIKMAKCGGIVEGIKLARVAKEAGKTVMLGCMVESSIGIAQAAYMASLADYFDLDGPLLLEKDIARGITYDREHLMLDHDMIGGPVLNQDVVQKQILH